MLPIRSNTIPTLLALIAVYFLATTITNAAGTDFLKPHRAVYDLSLREASNRSGIIGMNGRIVYEITGSKCDGYSVRFRFLTQVQTSRKSFTNDQRTTSYESGDGSMFTFVNQSYLNGQLEQDLRGKAQRMDTKTAVEITKPEESNINLGPSIFMTEHIGKLIEAAHNDQTIVTAKVFDASDNGDELVDTTAIIGKKKDEIVNMKGETDSVSSQFRGEAGWPVSVSYFSTSGIGQQGEKMPIYQVSFLMHESGVSRNLEMQYEDYGLKGDLKDIKYLKADKCE